MSDRSKCDAIGCSGQTFGAKPQWRRLLYDARDDSGSILIETALAFMLLMAMVLGIVEISMMAYTYAALENATREGVRYAAIHGTDSVNCSGPSTGCADTTAANVVSDVTSYAERFAGSLSGMQVTVAYPDGASTPLSRVQVMVAYTYQPLLNYLIGSQALNVSSEGRILY
ncbi:MAG: TadE/TadG family type IV pilus assembly protein [Acidobacteriaceae bacterium]